MKNGLQRKGHEPIINSLEYSTSRERLLRGAVLRGGRKTQLGGFARKALHLLRNSGELKVHAGLHKTGSSSLQRSLKLARLLQESSRSDFRNPQTFLLVFSEAWSKQRVVSSEHLLGEMDDLYQTAVDRVRLLAQQAWQTETTCYVRPHPEWHQSAFGQLIQQGTVTDRDKYEEKVLNCRYFEWSNLASDLFGLSSPATRLRFRSASDVVGDFSQVIGVPLPRVRPLNLSLSPMALEALIRLQPLDRLRHQEARRGLQTFMPESRFSYSVFSRRFQKHLKQMRGDWLEFSRIVGGEGQKISERWQNSYDFDILPPVREVFTDRDLAAAKEHIRRAHFI